MILTLACGKYRFNKLDFGTVAGLPRLLDIGQCNDVYSAILIANALADAFDTDVNGLPLSLIVSWYEQKAVADLLALLSLGIKNIYLGPTLPAFLSPNVLQYLVDTFQLRLISNPEDDIIKCTLCQGHYDFFLFRFLLYICLLCRGIKVMPLIDCFHLLL